MLELEVNISGEEPFRVHYWDFEKMPHKDGEQYYCTFKLKSPTTGLEEGDTGSVTLRADGIVTEYECTVDLVMDIPKGESQRIILRTDPLYPPEGTQLTGELA